MFVAELLSIHDHLMNLIWFLQQSHHHPHHRQHRYLLGEIMDIIWFNSKKNLQIHHHQHQAIDFIVVGMSVVGTIIISAVDVMGVADLQILANAEDAMLWNSNILPPWLEIQDPF